PPIAIKERGSRLCMVGSSGSGLELRHGQRGARPGGDRKTAIVLVFRRDVDSHPSYFGSLQSSKAPLMAQASWAGSRNTRTLRTPSSAACVLGRHSGPAGSASGASPPRIALAPV